MSVIPHLLRPVPFCCDVIGRPTTQAQWALICGLSLAILYFLLRSGKKKKKGDPLAKPPGQGTLAQQRSVERQMQNLLVELSEMARQITAQLDTRTTKLGLMIDDADEKAAMLQRVLDECRAALAAPPSAAAPPATQVPPPTLLPSDPPPPVYDDGPSIELANAADARHQRVYALADEGQSSSDIARQIDRPRGEVELILALRPAHREVKESDPDARTPRSMWSARAVGRSNRFSG